jgi:hypothetical protein
MSNISATGIFIMRTNLQTINHVNVVIKMSLGRVYGWKFWPLQIKGGRGNQWIGWETARQHAINYHYNELLLISSCCKLILVCKEPNAHLHPSLMANCVYVSSCRTNQHTGVTMDVNYFRQILKKTISNV